MEAEHKGRAAGSNRRKPTCFRCGRCWPESESKLCGICRAELGFPSIVAKRRRPEQSPGPCPVRIYKEPRFDKVNAA